MFRCCNSKLMSWINGHGNDTNRQMARWVRAVTYPDGHSLGQIPEIPQLFLVTSTATVTEGQGLRAGWKIPALIEVPTKPQVHGRSPLGPKAMGIEDHPVAVQGMDTDPYGKITEVFDTLLGNNLPRDVQSSPLLFIAVMQTNIQRLPQVRVGAAIP